MSEMIVPVGCGVVEGPDANAEMDVCVLRIVDFAALRADRTDISELSLCWFNARVEISSAKL